MTEITKNYPANYSSHEPRQVEREEEKGPAEESCTEKVARFCRIIPTVISNLFSMCGTGCITVCRDNSVCQRTRNCCSPVFNSEDKDNSHRMH